MKKLVVKLDLQDGKAKQKALKTVSTLQGIDSIAVDMKEKKLTVVGTVDPINVVSKLRKYWHTEIVLVGPAKEPEKKEEAAKASEEPKKEDSAAKTGEPKKEDEEEQKKNKEGGEGGDEAKKELGEEEGKKEAEQKKLFNEAMIINYNYDPRVLELVRAYRAYNPHMTTYYHVQSMEENPNACVIC